MNKPQTWTHFLSQALRCAGLGVSLAVSAPALAENPASRGMDQLPPPAIATVRVTENGIQRFSVAQLAELGLNVTAIPDNAFALYRHGQPVPLRVVADSNTPPEPVDRVFRGGFDPAPVMTASGYFEFVGFAEDSLYQRGIVYELRIDAGLEVSSDSRLPEADWPVPAYYWQETIQAPDTAYSFASPSGDPWYARRLLATGGPVSDTFQVTVSHPYLAGPPAAFSVRLWGGTDYPQDPDHHVQVDINGQHTTSVLFDGIQEQQLDLSVPMSDMAAGEQLITVTLPKDLPVTADLVHVESWSVRYPRRPVLIDGALSLETGKPAVELRGARNTGYAIYRLDADGAVTRIRHHQLDGNCAAQPSDGCVLRFAASPDGRSARYFVAEENALKQPVLGVPPAPEDIVSEKAEYLVIAHPDFIGPVLQSLVDRRAAQYTTKVVDIRQIYLWFSHSNVDAQAIADYIAFAVANMGTRQVLLVGGDTYDYQDKLGYGSVSFLPTLYAQTGDLIRYAPVDAKLADVDNDNIPDVALGRLLVRSEAELQTVIDKILAYEDKTYGRSAVFAADAYDAGQGYSFKQDALDLIGALPGQWQANITAARQAFVDDDGVAGARAKIIQAIEDGVALTSFVGHSGPKDWTFSGLFKANDALGLSNSGKPTLVTQWGCWNTYFVSPEEDTMAHAFMLNANGGAAAVLGASTLTRADAERGLAKIVLENLTHNGMSLGQAVLQAKRDWAAQNPGDLDVILGWNILGDPATML